MNRLTSAPRHGLPLGGVVAIVILLAACAGGLWLMLRLAPPLPWRLEIGLLTRNLVPHSPRPPPDWHRRVAKDQPATDPPRQATPQTGRTP